MIKHFYQSILISFSLLIVNAISIGQDFNGYALYNAQNSATTYLIDGEGEIAHSWSCPNNANYAVHLKQDGNLIRQATVSGARLNGAAYGGLIQEFDKNANIVWEFEYSTSEHQSHHDFAVLPNGNVILTAWEVKSGTEMNDAGYASNTEKWPTHFIEVQQDGKGGKIVWEWHIWDHLVQDKDDQKPNFGVIAEHPELIDINMRSSGGGKPGRGDGDWFHVNGIDYNADLDQLVFTSRFMSEFYIIDHSTTTAEAATHKGGNAGKGGDILFRYGKPANYGSSSTQSIAAACHDPRWIKSGRPNAGYIQFFNNEGGSGRSSVVDAVNPEMESDGYNYKFSNGSFQPTSKDWRHECKETATGQSASDRMSNGNVFVNLSRKYMYEMDTDGNVVWQYSASTPKAFRFECDYPGIIALLDDPCDVLSSSDFNISNINVYPNPNTGIVRIEGINSSEYKIQVCNMFGQIMDVKATNSQIDLSNFPDGNYLIKVSTDRGTSSHKLILVH